MDIYNDLNKARIEFNSNTGMPLKEVIVSEINDWLLSDKLKNMQQGKDYYQGKMDITEKRRYMINENGSKIIDDKVSNTRLEHQYLNKLTRQKVSYLLSEKLQVVTDNEKYNEILETIVDNRFHKLLKNVMTDAIVHGIAWVYPYISNNKLKFKRMSPTEIIPLWADNEHSKLDGAIRVYNQQVYEGSNSKIVTKVEWYDKTGVRGFILDGNTLIDDIEFNQGEIQPYLIFEEDDEVEALTWNKVPLVYFKYNDLEQPLLNRIKTFIDNENLMRSLNSDMLLDTPNSITIVRNYDAENPGQFRHNLSVYRTAFVSNDGDVNQLTAEINTDSYEAHIKRNRQDIFEFGGGVDTSIDKFGNSPSGIALQILYQDLDLDCNDLETEFQASLEYMMYFIDIYIYEVLQLGDYLDEVVEFIFTRNRLNNDAEIIESLNNSNRYGTLSLQTISEVHPFARENELERMEEESSKLDDELDQYVMDLESKLIDEEDKDEGR